jgi:glycosyltransferase involved in cell wall biosynthesis
MRVSVVLCTWNRADLLAGALDALVAQRDAPSYEIVVVDNASVDDTHAVLASAARRADRIRSLFESRPGLSWARNTGIANSAGEIIAFTDDDVRVSPHWIAELAKAFDRYPSASCVGGPVTPQWSDVVPEWLTAEQWAPLGVQDYGRQPFVVDAARDVCLIGANFAVRRDAFARVGLFDPAVQRVGADGGSTEDQEWQVRAWRAGLHGMYDPAVTATAVVPADRLRKRHHRRWHYGHGRHVARMHLPAVESSHRAIAGVPGHVLRQAWADAIGFAASVASRRTRAAFDREMRLWFAAGFLRERWG